MCGGGVKFLQFYCVCPISIISMKQLVFIGLLFCVVFSSFADLNNMRAFQGLYKKPGGGFCAVNLTKTPYSTPSFLKTSLKAGRGFKGVPACNTHQTKAFQEAAQRAYLQNNPYARKTAAPIVAAAGAGLLSMAKDMGIGCAFATVFSAAIEFAVWDSIKDGFRSLTEGGSPCQECLKKQQFRNASSFSFAGPSKSSSASAKAEQAARAKVKSRLEDELIEHETQKIITQISSVKKQTAVQRRAYEKSVKIYSLI